MTVFCISQIANIRTEPPVVVENIQTVQVMRPYQVKDIVEISGRDWYRLVGFPKNHLFQKDAFREL